VKQSLDEIFPLILEGSNLVWRPLFWAIKTKRNEENTDVNMFFRDSYIFGEGNLYIYNDEFELVYLKKINDLSIHDGTLSDNTDFGIKSILSMYLKKKIYIVWKWLPPNNPDNGSYDVTKTFYGLYDFTSDSMDLGKQSKLMTKTHPASTTNEKELIEIETNLFKLKNLHDISQSLTIPLYISPQKENSVCVIASLFIAHKIIIGIPINTNIIKQNMNEINEQKEEIQLKNEGIELGKIVEKWRYKKSYNIVADPNIGNVISFKSNPSTRAQLVFNFSKKIQIMEYYRLSSEEVMVRA